MPKRAERSEPFEPEFYSPAAPHAGRNIDRGGGGLANGMLGGRGTVALATVLIAAQSPSAQTFPS